MPKFSEDIETQLVRKVIDGEFALAARNRSQEDAEFDSLIDLIDSVREPKAYDWMSDIRLPEFVSHVLTQTAIDVDQYFRTRDFVEVYLEDKSPIARASAEAAKELINRTLNQRHLYYYQKFVRGKLFNNLIGRVYAMCWWERTTARMQTGTEKTQSPLDIDIEGQPIVDEASQQRAYRVEETPTYGEVPVVDRFNFDIVDFRNVFMDNKYCYSLQEKDWIIIRSEKRLDDLTAAAKSRGYFNLDELKTLVPVEGNTATAEATYNTGRVTPRYESETAPVNAYYDVLDRFGKFWAIVESTDDAGQPLEIRPGLDSYGAPLPDAELVEALITFAVRGSTRILIRFQPNPYRDSDGAAYKPLIRGLCYIHPVSDAGFGDGKNVRELQLAVDDTFNISNDRVMLATLPTLLTKRFADDDSSDVYIEPGHKIALEDPSKDLKALDIRDNVVGALNQIGLLRQMMQQVDAVYPPTMGDVPALASTTATAIAGAESNTDKRSNYKSITFENTFLIELYWMIQQMTRQFASPETGQKLMGDKVYDFDPSKAYFYKPLSQSIETEYSKANKIKLLLQMLQQVVAVQHPDTVKMFNFLYARVMTYLGDEFESYSDAMLNPSVPIQASAQGSPPSVGGPAPASNQSGVMQSGPEMMAREAMNVQ